MQIQLNAILIFILKKLTVVKYLIQGCIKK